MESLPVADRAPCRWHAASISQCKHKDDSGERHAGHEDTAEKRDRREAAEVQRPARAVSGRHEERRIVSITVKLPEAPVFGDIAKTLRPPETSVGPDADQNRQ